jgi:pyruvate,water dikinase
MSEACSVSTAEVLFRSFEQGFAAACARYGLLLDRMQVADVGGWLYTRPRPVGAPEKPGGLPPRFVFKLMLRLHPALRRRRRAAEAAAASELWRRDAEEWFERGRDQMRERLLSLQRREIAVMDGAALARHLDDVHAAAFDALTMHFSHVVAHGLGTGEWLARTAEWAGAAPEQAIAALRGASRYSLQTITHLDRLVDAMRASPLALAALDGDGSTEEKLQGLRQASPAVAGALDAYLEEHGHWVTGFDTDTPTLIQMPDALLSSITAHLAAQREAPAAGAASALRERVPAERRPEWDHLYETARLTYELRDSDAGPCGHWPAGLLREALLEAARRLQGRGVITQRAQIFEARHEEVKAMLLDLPDAPAAADLARRIERRLESTLNPPPLALGMPEGPPLPDDWLPGALRRINVALAFGMGSVFGGPPPLTDAETAESTTLRGVPASPGAYEGRACLVQGPEDFAKLQPGDILVAPFTTPVYNVVLPIIGGIVTDHGGLLSHAAIVAREYGIPAVVATATATSAIPHGARLRLDGATGLVTVLSSEAPPPAPVPAAT